MRFVAVSTCVLAVNLGCVACTGEAGTPSQSNAGTTATNTDSTAQTGGNSSSSSNKQSGGNTAQNSSAGGGGNQTSNTTKSTGGNTSSSTSKQTGGSTATGGRSTGGTNASSNPATGGRATGGTTSNNNNTGGRATGGAPTGGARATGGSPPATGGAATGGATSSGQTVPRLNGGQDGWASRYWDCCKPSCGWSGNTGGKTPVPSCNQDNSKQSGYDNQSACSGGNAYQCWDFAPWSVSDTLAYGYAAYNGVPCGTCMQLDFTGGTHNGNAASTSALANKTMIIQVINIGGIASDQFDLLIPGGGVGDFNACSTQWGTSDLGAQYGGFMLACNGDKTCTQNKCNTVFANKPQLKAGCDWFTGWFNAADNPSLKFGKVNCPSALTAKTGMSG